MGKSNQNTWQDKKIGYFRYHFSILTYFWFWLFGLSGIVIWSFIPINGAIYFLAYPSSIVHSKHFSYFNYIFRWFTKFKHLILGCHDIRLILYFIMTWGEIIITWGVTWSVWIFHLGCRCFSLHQPVVFKPYCEIHEWRNNFDFRCRKSLLSTTFHNKPYPSSPSFHLAAELLNLAVNSNKVHQRQVTTGLLPREKYSVTNSVSHRFATLSKFYNLSICFITWLKFRKWININLLVYKYTYYAAYGQQDYFRWNLPATL